MEANKKLNEYLKEHGISQIFIAEKLGVSPTRMSMMLNGKRKMTADDLIKICKILKVSPEMFM